MTAPNLTNETLDDVAARALASIILERTADALHDQGAKAAEALFNLHTDTGLVLDVCAAVLFATTGIAGPAGGTAETIYAMSLAMAEGAVSETPEEELDDDTTATPGITHEPPDDDDGVEDTLKVVKEAMVEAARANVPKIDPLPPHDGTMRCLSCRCAAVGMVEDVPVCFYHVDHEGIDSQCPMCAAPPVAPQPEPKTRKRAVKA